MRALVTGGGGFAGRHLVSVLAEENHAVWAADRDVPEDLPAGARGLALDVTDGPGCCAALEQLEPEVVFHLAAVAQVAQAEADPQRCLAVNFGGTCALLDACRQAAPGARVMLVSSCEVYGSVRPEDVPVLETCPLRPVTQYALSKACAEMAAQRAVARGLDVVILRPFNHFGPGQSDRFVTAAFAHQLARIEAGQQEPVLRVGNLEAVRDFSDVRATVQAYVRAAGRARTGEVYNVTAGAAVRIRDLLDVLLSLARVDVAVETDPDRLRPVEVPAFHGSPDKFAREIGALPPLDLNASLAQVLDYWRARLAAAEVR